MYHKIHFALTNSKAKKITHALKNNLDVTLRLSKTNIHSSGIPLMLTEREIKSLDTGKSHNIKISHSRLKEHEKVGGFLPLLALLAPIAAAALAGGASISSIVRNAKAIQKGNGLYINPRGRGNLLGKNCHGVRTIY